MKGIIYFVAIAVIFAFALEDVFATKPGDEFQSNRLVLAGDAASIDQKIMDTDIKRSGMNGTNNIIGAEMEACEDQKSEKTCQKWKKKGKCATEKVAKVCKKTCDLCQDDCHDTLESLHCLSECPTPVIGSDPSNYHHILGRCYYFEATEMPFDEAMENCKTIFGSPGGRLFEPRNSVVNDQVGDKAIGQENYGQAWIGIRTDPDPAPRHFYWLSGGPFTSLSYGQWNTGEPNNAGNEDCVFMYVQPGGPSDASRISAYKRWNDVDCSREFPSICEIGHEVIW